MHKSSSVPLIDYNNSTVSENYFDKVHINLANPFDHSKVMWSQSSSKLPARYTPLVVDQSDSEIISLADPLDHSRVILESHRSSGVAEAQFVGVCKKGDGIIYKSAVSDFSHRLSCLQDQNHDLMGKGDKCLRLLSKGDKLPSSNVYDKVMISSLDMCCLQDQQYDIMEENMGMGILDKSNWRCKSPCWWWFDSHRKRCKFCKTCIFAKDRLDYML